MMPNRLQTHWETMKPKILSRWNRLAEADLEKVDGRFDRVVELVRARYKPGRSRITVEAKIYDWLLQELHDIERGTP